ncbi:InlB B-repeat-containing protein, partial [Peptoniphilus grossensis]|uniref:InlB B-repeat-containing protein n=1 Tax=Peptoniphilus grossensis TaxID=1465756 RepID=UPI0040687EC2
MVGLTVAGNESGIYPLTPVNDRKEREVDLGEARGDLTNQRKNLPINLVLKEGVTIEDLGQRNYIVQMRLTDTKGVRVYSYAPKGTSMDYSTYTKTTSVSLEDKVNRLFIKGGYQKDGKNATAQESFMSEFIANPDQYEDKSNLGIIRTQYTGQRAGNDKIPTVGGEQIAFTQAFDANLLNYLKPDKDGNVAYVNVFKNTRLKSKWSHNVGIKLKDFNKTADGNLAYLVIGTHDFQKDDVKKVEVTDHDQYTMIQGYYITGIDYVVDKSKFEDTFAGRDDLSGGNKTRKLDYSMISGWTNPNTDGWVVYEKEYDSGYTAQEGESYIIDTTSDPTGGQIMLQIGNEDAIIRKQQGYYSYYITSDKGIEKIEKFADGIFKFDLREGATVKSGDKLKIFMPYTKDHKDPVNFLEIHNGTKINEGGATLKLQKDRNINMHLYKEGKKGYYILKYTLADGTKAEKKFEPKGLWKFDNKDRVMDPGTNGSILSSGGNFYINTKKLTPGADIIVESYDENDNKLEDQTSWFKYRTIEKSTERVKELTWTDSSDTSSILSVNKSLYTPYQLLFTNDYAEGTDDFYKDPKALPANNDDFKKDTKEFVGYTKYDGGKVRTLYEEGKIGKLFAKVQAAENEYDDKGNLVGEDVSKKITIPKANIFDPHFAGDNKEYRAYEYKVDLTKMLPYHSEDKTETPLTLLKDMKFVSTASDGSSLPSDLLETRVRARVLFDANTGKLADGKDKEVKIVPDNTKFYGEEGYAANGFEGANVEANTGDKFPEAPTLAGKNFLGWVTEAGKTALGDKAVVTADAFAKLSKDQIFTNETPVTKHLVVYAIYSEDVAVTFDANQGKFGDKDQVTVKVEGGNATAPTENPTREGYTFKGWAATKDATEADANILNNVTAAKTVYAVWEKTAEELQLNDPTPVEVKDTKNLTSDEKDKVADAVIAANSTLTKADITVADDGTVTVKTKDGKTATLSPEKTVKQKEVQNNFNPPKEPVKVENAKALTDTEKQAVKEAIKEANPDRNFTDEDITVNDDGSVKINQGGKVGSFTPDQTVVQKDTILDLTAPEKTEVKDTTNLTQEERDKVAAAVKAKNSLPDTATIVVDNNGNVKVTDGTKTGKLEGKDTVKPFDRAGKTLNDPAITTVSNPAKLTDAEKRAVKDAVMAANKDLGFTYEEIKVADDGTVTVPMGKDENKTIEPAKTVRQATAEDKIIALKAPEKTEVVDKTNLTDDEKAAVKKAVEDANKDGSGNSTLPAGATITVANDGSVTVTQGEGENKKVGQLSQNDTVIEKIKAPTTPVEVADPSHLTDDEKEAVKKAVKDANPKLPADAKVTVGNDGSVTVTDKDGKEIGTLTPAQTVKKAGETD